MYFAKDVSLKSYGKILLHWQMSALRRLRVQSDLLEGTALEALLLLVFTKGPINKIGVGTSQLTRPQLNVSRFSFRMPHHTLDHTHPLKLSAGYIVPLCTLVLSLLYVRICKAHATETVLQACTYVTLQHTCMYVVKIL